VAEALREFSGEEVTSAQVYNHLRKWKQRWGRVCKLKDLSGALWDDDTKAIMLEQDHYVGHVKVPPLFSCNTYFFQLLQLPVLICIALTYACFSCCRTTPRMLTSSTPPLGSMSRWRPSLADPWPLVDFF